MNRIISEDYENLLSVYDDKFEGLKNSTVLITGANGMIASYLSEFLSYIAKDYNIQLYLQCRNLERARKKFGQYLDSEYIHLVNFDFEDNDIPDIRFDYIMHAASPASSKPFEETPVDVISPNVLGTWYLLQHAKKKGIRKFLLFSAGSVYGEVSTGDNVVTENSYGIVDPLWNRSCYIESKRLAEQMCFAFWRQYEVPASFIRICHTYGPTFDLQRDTRIIPRVIKQILQNEDIEIYKDPDSVIQYTYIADMVSAILLVLLEGKDGEAYNAGADELVSMDDIIKWMVNADNSIQSTVLEKKADENYIFGKSNGTKYPKLSNHKLSELGWKQLYSAKKGFERVVKYYLEEPCLCGGVSQ